MWGSGPSDIYVVGKVSTKYIDAVVYRYNGSTWSQLVLTATTTIRDGGYRAVFGAGKNDVYVVGDKGYVSHYNGKVWTALPKYSGGNLAGAWADSTGRLVAVGEKGTVARYERPWQEQNSGVSMTLRALWGHGPTDLFAVGDNYLLRWDGKQWGSTQVTVKGTASSATLTGLWGSSATDLLAVGNFTRSEGQIYAYNGATWSEAKGGSTSMGMPLYAVWTSGAKDSYAAGSSTISSVAPILYSDGSGWKNHQRSAAVTTRDLFGFAGTKVYAVGSGGTIQSWGYSGTSWSKETSGVTSQLNGVWGASASSLVAVGEKGVILTKNTTGTTWTRASSNTTADLYEVWGSLASDVYAVGASGAVVRFDGKSWQPEITGVSADLRAVWGDAVGWVYAVGDKGKILRRCWP